MARTRREKRAGWQSQAAGEGPQGGARGQGARGSGAARRGAGPVSGGKDLGWGVRAGGGVAR